MILLLHYMKISAFGAVSAFFFPFLLQQTSDCVKMINVFEWSSVSVSFGFEDYYKLKMKQIWGCRVKRSTKASLV